MSLASNSELIFPLCPLCNLSLIRLCGLITHFMHFIVKGLPLHLGSYLLAPFFLFVPYITLIFFFFFFWIHLQYAAISGLRHQPNHCSDNAGSLTCCATRELLPYSPFNLPPAFFLSFVFLGPHPWHVEVRRLGV